MAEALFRNEVIEAGRERLTGTVVAAVPPTSRLYARIVLGVAAVLLLFLVLGSYATTADVRGVVAYDAGVARVYPRSAGEVRQIHVHSGDRVVAGQPLITLAIAQGQGGLVPQMGQLANQDAEIGRQLGLARDQGAADAAALDRQREGLEAAIVSLERQRDIAAGQIKLAEAAAKRATRLAGMGAGTQRQVEDARSTVLARRAEFEALDERLIGQREALRTNRSDRTKGELEARRGQSVLLGQRAQLAEQRAELSRAGELVLTAPVAGVVGDISTELGQQATPEKSLASVVPDGSALEVWLYAPTRAVGNARSGQAVRLHFDAFPHEKFGAGEGLVRDVARVPTEAANLDPGLKIDEPVFRVRTRIVSFAPKSGPGIAALRPGMTVSGKLVLERRSLWQLLFGALYGATGQ